MEKINKLSSETINFYPHRIDGIVKFHEVDSFNIVHNLQYLYWVEWARILYLEKIGIELSISNLREFPVVTVHNEIDYFAPATFGDRYYVYSRIKTIKNSSFVFENVVTFEDSTLIAKASSVLVLVNPSTMESVRIPDSIREKIKMFENNNVEITD